MVEVPQELREALLPFIMAAAVGHTIEMDVADAKPNQHSARPLLGFPGYVGQYAAQSRVSWADWKRLLDAYDNVGLLQADMEARALSTSNGDAK